MDIGHIRNLTWAKDNDQKKGIAYNRLRGQYMSALEHAVPERLFNDPAQCNLVGMEKPVVGLPNSPQGSGFGWAWRLMLAKTQGSGIMRMISWGNREFECFREKKSLSKDGENIISYRVVIFYETSSNQDVHRLN